MTPLVLLVGFLGAGKTSLLRQLVPLLRQEGTVPSIILNDYQNAKVDAALFRQLQAEVTPISGSCVCCGSRQELLEAMDAYEHRENGVLLVETNGTTDSGELVTLLAADPRLRRFSLPFQISVVDAKRWQKRFWHNGLEADQLATASVVFLGHTDEVDEARLKVVVKSLARAGVPLPPRTTGELAGELAALVREAPSQQERSLEAPHHHDHHGHSHDHGHAHAERHHFSAVETALPATVDRTLFEEALRGMPEEILRAKGLVRFTGEPEALHIFQKIGKFDAVQMAPLEGNPVIDQPLAVFIGAQIEERFVSSFLSVLQGQPAPA